MPLLSLRGMTKRFGGLPAVDAVDLDVEHQGIVALIGPNGAGKSTLLSLVSGGQRPTHSRSLTLDGRSLLGLAPNRIRRAGIGTVTQTPSRFASLTVREEVAIGARFGTAPRPTMAGALQEADEAVEFVGLAARARDPVSTLTLHEARLLGLARALAGRPQLLLADEVMAGLTTGELDQAIALFRRLRDEKQIAVLWVEHVMSAVEALADRVVVMDVGRIIADGPANEVRRDPSVVTAYLGVPAGGGGDALGS